MVTDLVALTHQELELFALVLGLVEEAIRLARARKHVERAAAAEIGMLALKGLEDTDAGLGVDLDGAVALDVAELARRGVVEGEYDRRRPGRQADAPVEELAQVDQPVALGVERLEVTTEVLGRSGPLRLGVVDLVVLEDHEAAELVGGEPAGTGERDEQQSRGKNQRENEQKFHLVPEASFCRRAPAV